MPEDDRFGIDPFARALARGIRNLKSPIGTTLALNGSWGSGKSSAVNLICHHLDREDQSGKFAIIDFKCWWFRGEEALTLAFLQELNGAIRKTLSEKAKKIIPRLGKTLLQAGHVFGPAVNIMAGGVWGMLTTGGMDFAKRFFPEGESIEKLFQELSKALAEQNKRFLILIDDIDRLTPDEALLVFRLIKSVGRLPNVMYLLVFDRILAEKAVKEKYPSEGPHFLEKIIQASFELPLPARDDLNSAVLTHIESLCGQEKDMKKLQRFMNIFYDVISPYINTPRDLTRLSNATAISWPAIANEVNVADYMALEIIRLFEPALYNAIRSSKDRVCGIRSSFDKSESPEKNIQGFLKLVSDDHQEYAKLALMRLFPRFENVGYGAGFIEQWEAQRLVCTEKHFDTYFHMSIGDETLSISDINEFVNRCGDGEYVKQTFRNALGVIRKNGKSRVPLLLDELNVHAARIAKDKFQSLISGIFEIADEIDRKEDRELGGFSTGNNHLRIHWLIRKLTFDRCNLDERNKIFLEACKSAQLGWLVNFTTSANEDYFRSNGKEPQPSEKCLLKKESISELKSHAIKIIESAAVNGDLIGHPRLSYILFRWRELKEDNGAGVKSWTSAQLNSDETVSIFARAFTGENWSQGIGMFGLGDRVAIRNVQASIEGLADIMDVSEFRRRLSEIEKNNSLGKEDMVNVLQFLNHWRKQEMQQK